MELLRRHLAPITDSAWEEIDEQAIMSLTQFLSARKIVDIEGPEGWDLASVPTGHVTIEKSQNPAVSYAVRQQVPLLEPRVRFTLNRWELDNIERGSQDPELEPLEDAAKKIAFFEEQVIYKGLKKLGIAGLLQTDNKPLKLPADESKWVDSVIEGVYRLKSLGIEGPYALSLSPAFWQKVNAITSCGCSRKEQLERFLEGPVLLSHYLDSGALVSLRGGDFAMTLGGDLSIGYEDSTAEEVTLYLTESFTFQVFEPNAAIQIVKP